MRVFTKYEYDKLTSCIMAYPYNIKAPSISLRVDTQLAIKQFEDLRTALKDKGVEIYILGDNGSPSRVFTRDIGFIIEDILFISKMTPLERQNEIDALIDFARENNVKSHVMQNRAEGGDILVHNNKVFIGIGFRTAPEAIQEINQVLSSHNKHYEFVSVFFNTERIHLDCVLNILAEDTCIFTKEILNLEEVLRHFSRSIEAPVEEQASLPTNIVDLGNNILLCSSEVFCQTLEKEGYNPQFIEFSEILKASGSLGCCVLPLVREPDTKK